MNAFSKTIIATFFLSITATLAVAQLPASLELPRVSPFETRSITIGYTTIGFEYSSVGIKGRDIWGELIPYGQVWRTGANENTVFSVTDDVLINGNPLPAGTYGLHSIPGEESWTLIFSNFSDAWGSYFYDESEDQLRLEVSLEEMNSTYEWMKFSFENYTDTSVDMSLKWAGLKVPFTVEVPREVTFRHITNQFRTLPAFRWQGWFQGANYALDNEYQMGTGLEWANNAVNRERNTQTLTVKARLHAKTGEEKAAIQSAEELISEFPDEWRAYYGAALTHQDLEDMDNAIELIEQAIELAPDNVTSQLATVLQRMRNQRGD